MAEAIIKTVREVTEEDFDGDIMYAFWCEAYPKGGDSDQYQLCKVLAKSSNKWSDGAEVTIEGTEDEWEGPDGDTYFYCKFKKPGGFKGGGKAGGARRQQRGGTSGRTAGARADKPMETITYADAKQVHKTFLADAIDEAFEFIGGIVETFEDENKPSSDAILRAAYDAALRIANQRFGGYTKSFRIAAAAATQDEDAEEAEQEAEESSGSETKSSGKRLFG